MAGRSNPCSDMTSMTIRLSPLVFLLVIAVAGCTADEPEPPARDVAYFEAQGRVMRILENSRLVQIDHGVIEGFMPAMTMPFEYRSDSVRQALVVGDSIHFTVASDGIDNWVTTVRAIR